CVSLNKCDIPSLVITKLAQRVEKLNYTDVASCGIVENTNSRSRSLRLRWDNGGRHVRPRGRRAAEQRDELAPLHSITSSAVASSFSGTVRPRLVAVFRLMANSNLTGASTGRSAGLAPFRMRST